MEEEDKYEQELIARLKAAQRRVTRSRQAKMFTGSGQVVIDIAQDRISELVTSMASKNPLGREEYLDAHGQVVGIKYILDMLMSRSTEEESAVQEVKVIDEQLKQFAQDKKQ